MFPPATHAIAQSMKSELKALATLPSNASFSDSLANQVQKEMSREVVNASKNVVSELSMES